MRLNYLSQELCQHYFDADRQRIGEFQFRDQSSWYSQAHALVTTAKTAFALGRPLDEVRAWLRQATAAYRELFSLRGTTFAKRISYRDGQPLPEELVPSDGYTSNDSFEAGMVALILRGVDEARELVTLAGHSPEAALVSPKSEVCTTNQQSLSHALNALLDSDCKLAIHEASTVAFGRANQIEKQIALTMKALAQADYPLALSERDALLFYHEKMAARIDHQFDRDLWLSLPALGLTALAIRLGGIAPLECASQSPYCPIELITD